MIFQQTINIAKENATKTNTFTRKHLPAASVFLSIVFHSDTIIQEPGINGKTENGITSFRTKWPHASPYIFSI